MPQSRLPQIERRNFIYGKRFCKKGKKWYYRFYIEDERGRQVQKEFAGTESKSETETLLRKAMEDYEAKKFVDKADNITIGEMLDMWIEEDLKSSSLSNGTIIAYIAAVLQGSFRFAVFPKRFITFNPMQYVKLRGRKDNADIFCDDDTDTVSRPPITHEQYLKLTGLSEGQGKSRLTARTNRLLYGTSHWRGLRLDLVGHQS